jgi:xylose isomerase
MDAFARGLKSAAAIRADGLLAEIVKNRYASWDCHVMIATRCERPQPLPLGKDEEVFAS